MQNKEEAKKQYIEQGASDTLFTTKDICRICGISRAQLILLEEDGILKPRMKHRVIVTTTFSI